MSQSDIVSPIATDITQQCVITPPWFVQGSEYHPLPATYYPLINGEEAFGAVHHAIENARKSVDIICWGFQPSMYFVRDGKAPCIGQLLIDIAEKRGVEVRILAWEMPFNTAGFGDEANLPGKFLPIVRNRAGQTSTDTQFDFDCWWFKTSARFNTMKEMVRGKETTLEKLYPFPHFVSRGFNTRDRAEIAYQAKFKALDKNLSNSTIATMAGTVTHHQKTVLVDYELPERAVGFVMGHNMLDEYWDTDAHSARNRGANAPEPNKGATGALPRQDISSRVTGPVLEHLHHNFATAWQKETGQNLLWQRNASEAAKNMRPQKLLGTPIMAQLLRTQAQVGKRDIEKLYLQATNNATQFIYIENQYFRWPPLAELIKKVAADQTRGGRDPGKHGSLYLFVTTNVTDGGIGAGTVNTQRMLESLGRADAIPGITKLRRKEALWNDMPGPPSIDASLDEKIKYIKERKDKEAEVKAKIQEIDNSAVIPVEHPGLKIHVCSLVAPDSEANNWMPVYIHSKLMIINDVFTTHGSANINTRSMQVDSEMNIAHCNASVTKEMRKRLWNLHTNNEGGQDDIVVAFDRWGKIIMENKGFLGRGLNPFSSIVGFNYKGDELADLD